MDKFNALYAQIKLAQRAAERDEARKEAEREAETRWMLEMVNRSSEERFTKQRRTQQEARYARYMARIRRYDIAADGFAIAGFCALLVSTMCMFCSCWTVTLWTLFASCLMSFGSAICTVASKATVKRLAGRRR